MLSLFSQHLTTSCSQSSATYCLSANPKTGQLYFYRNSKLKSLGDSDQWNSTGALPAPELFFLYRPSCYVTTPKYISVCTNAHACTKPDLVPHFCEMERSLQRVFRSWVKLICFPNLAFLKIHPQTNNIIITWEHVIQILSPSPDLLNQKLWSFVGWGYRERADPGSGIQLTSLIPFTTSTSIASHCLTGPLPHSCLLKFRFLN